MSGTNFREPRHETNSHVASHVDPSVDSVIQQHDEGSLRSIYAKIAGTGHAREYIELLGQATGGREIRFSIDGATRSCYWTL